MNKFFGIALFSLFILAIGCQSDSSNTDSSGSTSTSNKEYKDQATVHQLSDPEGLHPHCTTGASSSQVKRNMFHRLLEYDHASLKLVPLLAKKLPTVEIIGDNKGMKIDYELKEGAKWDDGTPITAADVAFSFKNCRNPKVNAANIRPYIEFIEDIKLYPEDPLKITFICNKVYFLWDHVTGTDVVIAPKSFYDKDGLSDKFTYAQIASGDKKVVDSDSNIAFAKHYNDINFQRENVSGSGPYKFVKWDTGKRIVLERKENWWGDKYESEGMYFEKGPKTIVYEVINDMNAALTSLKNEDLDAMTGFKPVQWHEDIPNSKTFNANYNKYKEPSLSYTYIGMNTRSPILSGKKTRQALSHLMDKKNINDNLLYGDSDLATGPIHPKFKEDYNSSIKGYEYSVEKAKKLLAEDGWEDANNDGTLDKMIDGVRQDFEVDYTFTKGSETTQKIGLAFQEAARGAGIKINVTNAEWAVFLQKLSAHEIDMWFGGWSFDPRPSDPKQIWHTESYNGGSNYTGFGNEETDALIERIRKELDNGKRSAMYQEWQEILHEEAPYIFMYTGKRKMGIHKRFDNLHLTSRGPGFYVSSFQQGKGATQSIN